MPGNRIITSAGTKRICAALCALWIAACTAVPSPDVGKGNPSATVDLTPTPATEAYPSPSIRPTGNAILPPILLIPTLEVGSPVKVSGLSYLTFAPSLQMIDAQTGWAVQYLESGTELRPWLQEYRHSNEGHILRTTNGGKTWQNITPPVGVYTPRGFFALDANHAWAIENVPCCTDMTATRVWRTIDGGATWKASQPIPLNGRKQFHITGPFPADVVGTDFYWPDGMQFVDPNNGWLLVTLELDVYIPANTLFHTTNGGATWKEVNNWDQDLGIGCAAGLGFINSTTGWYGQHNYCQARHVKQFSAYFGEGGWKVLHTTDAGDSFSYATTIPTPPELQQLGATNPDTQCGETRVIAFASDVVGIEWACIMEPDFWIDHTYYSLSADAGHTWNTWKSTGNEFFLNATHGWRLVQPEESFESDQQVLSPAQLQQTTDGGLNWAIIKTVAWEDAKFDFISELEGWAVVTIGDQSFVAAFLHTRDAGRTWEEIKPVIASP